VKNLLAADDIPGMAVAVTYQGQVIPIRKAVYHPSSLSVSLTARFPFALARKLEVEVIGSGMSGLDGVSLDGSGRGQPGSNFVATFAPRFHQPSVGALRSWHHSFDTIDRFLVFGA
jgi:hypothetical protein